MSLTISFNKTSLAPVSEPSQHQQNLNEMMLSHEPAPNQAQEQEQQQETCFSFKKQPIPSRTSCHSAISSFIEPNHTLNKVSSIKTQNSTTVQASPRQLNTDQDFQLNYDEQIRAPRMSTLSKTNSIVRILEHEPLGDCDFIHRNSNDSTANEEFSNSSRNTSLTSNTSMDLATLENQQLTSIIENHPQHQTKQYCPATYDLSQPLRRYSTPSISENKKGDNDQKTHQYTYAQIAKRALQNLQTNQTSSELMKRKDPRERINTDGPIRQIDEPKTPNYIPAVLRPPNFQSSHAATRKPSFSSLGDHNGDDIFSRTSSPTRQLSNTSISSSTSTVRFMELPKSHWVANNERSACSMCDSKFSIINRKHHCRKCGDIFCFNCCYIRASLNFKLNFDLVNGIVVKVCNNCAVDYTQYIRKNFASEGNSTQSKDQLQVSELMEKERNNSAVVPVDWNWSSF